MVEIDKKNEKILCQSMAEIKISNQGEGEVETATSLNNSNLESEILGLFEDFLLKNGVITLENFKAFLNMNLNYKKSDSKIVKMNILSLVLGIVNTKKEKMTK